MRINTLVIFLLVCNLAPVFIGKEIFSQPPAIENWQLSSVLLEKESDKGNYLIQLKSSYSHDVHNFPIEIEVNSIPMASCLPRDMNIYHRSILYYIYR